jgi:hypothetical protein
MHVIFIREWFFGNLIVMQTDSIIVFCLQVPPFFQVNLIRNQYLYENEEVMSIPCICIVFSFCSCTLLMMLLIKMAVFWVVAQCRLIQAHQHFRGPYWSIIRVMRC